MAAPTHGGLSQWRHFNFFKQTEIKDAQDVDNPPQQLKALTPPYTFTSPHPQSPLASNVSCILCNDRGCITLLDDRFEEKVTWQAWNVDGSPAHVAEQSSSYSIGINPLAGKGKQTPRREKGLMLIEVGGVLIGIGEDDSPTQSQFPILRIWNLMKTDSNTNEPLLIKNVRIGTGGRGYPVSTLAVTPTLDYLAIGLVSGQVLLYRHLLQSLIATPIAHSTFPKARTAWEGTAAEPITGLGLTSADTNGHHHLSATSGIIENANIILSAKAAANSSVGLFILTTNRTVVIPVITGRGSEPKLLEENGASLGCSTMSSDYQEFIVGRDEGLSVYGIEGRGANYPYEGSKLAIRSLGNSLIIISPFSTPATTNRSSNIRKLASSIVPAAQFESARVSVFDLENKLVSMNNVVSTGVRGVLPSGSSAFYVLDGSGKVFKNSEIPLTEKLEALYHKYLFQLAISMAKAEGMDEAELSDIYLRYGDHLYSKGDFDGAMVQYIRTLGYVQPSHVIRKFLDAHRTLYLTLYLEELHKQGLATTDHTTLLLNCYTKNLDKARLDAFIKVETKKFSPDTLPFDLDTAIRVCRQAGFFEHALYLAKQYKRHQEYFSIQFGDLNDVDAAFAYLRSLPCKAAGEIISPHVKALLQRSSQATTELLIDLCSGWGIDTNGSSHAKGMAESTTSEKPDPRQFFSDFVDHLDSFAIFLEAVADRRWDQRLDVETKVTPNTVHVREAPLPLEAPASQYDSESQVAQQQAVWNTLLEVYLTKARLDQPDQSSVFKDKAQALVSEIGRIPVDPVHAMMLCSSFGFETGLIRLWDRLGMFEDIMRFWMQQPLTDDSSGGSRTKTWDGRTASESMLYYLNIYGPSHLHLYPLVLRHITSSSVILEQHGQDVQDILDIIDSERIMPPLAVIQLLSRNQVTTIGVVKSWLKSRIADTRQDISSDKQLVKSYWKETDEKLKELANLSDINQPQVFQVTRCASCGGQLDLPSVHFMCKHSYHQRCLSDIDPECPACAKQYAVMREIRKNQESLGDRHDLFLAEVGDATDGFAVIAAAYGRGLLNRRVADEDTTDV